MDVFIWIAILAIFFAQLAVVAVIIQRYKRKTADLPDVKQPRTAETSSEDLRDGKKYFFEKNEKTPPLFRFYGEIKQFGIKMFTYDAILCDLDELSELIDKTDPLKGSFFIVITDERLRNTLQFQCDRPDSIEVSVTGRSTEQSYLGMLVFAGDMKHFMMDYFSGVDVVSRYSLKQGEI